MTYFFFIFCFFGPAVNSLTVRCPPLFPVAHGSVSCFFQTKRVECASALLVGSMAEFACFEFYQAKEQRSLECLSNGSWSSAPPKCVPECGKRSESVSLVIHGLVAAPGAFPWHAALYNQVEEEYEFWCGGSLISETVVLTAAHCTWKVSLEKLILVFGKSYRDYDVPKETVQRIKPREIRVLGSYQDVEGNYNGDLAVVFLERPVVLGPRAAPVCVDWEQRLVDEQVREGALGTVAGWGLTENDSLSDVLRWTRLPVVSDERCIAEQSENFRKFVTYVSFCAGYGNGSGVCNGDSGGGLTFFDEASDRWYLQGLVSVSPRKKGTPFCDPNFYTIFTKVTSFSRWLSTMKEEILGEGNELAKRNSSQEFNHLFKKMYGVEFPHSNIMLQLAKINNNSYV